MGAEDEGGEGMVGEDITHKDWCPTDSTDLHGYYSVGLTKTDINPLKSMGRCPAVMLPLLSYKSKLLTPKP